MDSKQRKDQITETSRQLVIQTKELIDGHEAEIQALKDANVELVQSVKAIADMKILPVVVEHATNEGMTPGEWLLDAVVKATEDSGLRVQVNRRVHEKLEALARGRGLSIDELTQRSGFSEFIEAGLKRGAI